MPLYEFEINLKFHIEVYSGSFRRVFVPDSTLSRFSLCLPSFLKPLSLDLHSILFITPHILSHASDFNYNMDDSEIYNSAFKITSKFQLVLLQRYTRHFFFDDPPLPQVSCILNWVHMTLKLSLSFFILTWSMFIDFLEKDKGREEGRERQGEGKRVTLVWERNFNWLLPVCSPTGNQTCKLGMYREPGIILNWWPFGVWDYALSHTSHTSWATPAKVTLWRFIFWDFKWIFFLSQLPCIF